MVDLLIKDEVYAFKLNPNLTSKVEPRRTNSIESVLVGGRMFFRVDSCW
jgi:hypothetical protein